MIPLSINDVLASIQAELSLSTETEYELLEEIRGHLEDAVEEAHVQGQDKQTALLKAAEKFGVTEVGQALQEVHAPWESAEAILVCFVPVLTALILRWLAFAPDGTALGWQMWLLRPAFWVVAAVLLFIPLIQFQKWRYTVVSWGFFWLMTIIFVALPNIQSW